MTDDTPLATDHHQDAGLSERELLHGIRRDVRHILERLATGDTAIALLQHRVAALERIVYTMVGAVLLAFLAAIIALVVRSHP